MSSTSSGCTWWWMSWIPASRVRTSLQQQQQHILSPQRTDARGNGYECRARTLHKRTHYLTASVQEAHQAVMQTAEPNSVAAYGSGTNPVPAAQPQLCHACECQLPEVPLLNTTGHEGHGDVSLDAVDAHPGGYQGQDAAAGRSNARHKPSVPFQSTTLKSCWGGMLVAERTLQAYYVVTTATM